MARFASNQIPTGGAFDIATQSDEIQKAGSDVLKQFADAQKQIDASGAFRQLNEAQKNLASNGFTKQLADVQKQIDAGGALKQLNEAQKAIASSGFVKQLAGVQKQIDASGVLKQFNEVQKNLASSGFVKQLADVHKQIDASGVLKQLGDFRTQLAGTDVASVYSALGQLNQRVSEDRARWDRIEHSFDNLNTQKNELQVPPIRISNIGERLERSLSARSKLDRDALAQQSALLASIAEAGKKQNETMAEIAKLQSMLVGEAVENTKIQRTFLYFTALGAALALFALIVK
jgi:hypothetical protein